MPFCQGLPMLCVVDLALKAECGSTSGRSQLRTTGPSCIFRSHSDCRGTGFGGSFSLDAGNTELSADIDSTSLVKLSIVGFREVTSFGKICCILSDAYFFE